MVTKENLLKRIKKEGIEIGGNPSRMLAKYISLGLIEKPIRYGLGKGKGLVSEFDDNVVNQIKEIVKLRDEGLTYEKIKHKRRSHTDWEKFFGALKKSSGVSDEAFVNAIRKIPYMSDAEKGRLKLITDLTEHLAKVVVNEIDLFLGGDNDEHSQVFREVYDSLEFGMSNIIEDYSIWDREYVDYLDGKSSWGPPPEGQRITNELLKEAREEIAKDKSKSKGKSRKSKKKGKSKK